MGFATFLDFENLFFSLNDRRITHMTYIFTAIPSRKIQTVSTTRYTLKVFRACVFIFTFIFFTVVPI